MATTPFKALDWNLHDVITKDQMDQYQSNMQWLLDNTPRARYTDYKQVHHDTDIVVLAGRILIPRNKYSHNGLGHVRFGAVFEPGHLPNISTTVCTDQKKRVFCVVNGLGSTLNPDYRGFDVRIYVPDISTRPARVRGRVQKDKPDRAIYVMWTAVGKRRV